MKHHQNIAMVTLALQYIHTTSTSTTSTQLINSSRLDLCNINHSTTQHLNSTNAHACGTIRASSPQPALLSIGSQSIFLMSIGSQHLNSGIKPPTQCA